MRVVTFECGCVAILDSSGKDAIIIRRHEKPNMPAFIPIDSDLTLKQSFEVVGPITDKGHSWATEIASLIKGGAAMMQVKIVVDELYRKGS